MIATASSNGVCGSAPIAESMAAAAGALLRRDAEIAVRMVRPEQKALVARKVGKTALGLRLPTISRRSVRRHGWPIWNGIP